MFTESPMGGFWRGQLLNPAAKDRQNKGKRAQIRTAAIAENSPENRGRFGSRDGYDYVMQGGTGGSRRYGWAPTLTEAQEALREWARRRYYVEVEA